MQTGPERRLVGGALRLEPIGPGSFNEFAARWEADPIWRSTLVPSGVEAAEASDARGWPLEQIRDPSRRLQGPLRVRNEVPHHYEAYVRVLCPFVGPEVAQAGKVVGHELVSWNETALRNGRVPHRLMGVVGIGPDHRDTLHGGHAPYQALHPAQESALFRILQSHTASDIGWFLLWDGDYFGSLEFGDDAKVELPGTNMYFCLFRGPLSACDGFWTPPRWWWPDDKVWCFQSNVDLDMTNCFYLGASRACVEAILACPILEALIADPDDLVLGKDTINLPNPN